MTPLSYIFMFCSMIELHNETTNCKGYLSTHHDPGIESEPVIEVSKCTNTENSDSNSKSNSSFMLLSDTLKLVLSKKVTILCQSISLYI